MIHLILNNSAYQGIKGNQTPHVHDENHNNKDKDNIHYKELYKKALHYNQCVFDEFYAYEK